MDEDGCVRAAEAFRRKRNEIVGTDGYAEILKAAALPDVAGEDRRCPDQYVGWINDVVARSGFPTRVDSGGRPDSACVILILESPHKDEFGEFPGPAKGRTGKNIAKFIEKVHGLEDKASFGLVLMNAVQYRCSLGLPTAFYRDQVFRSVWHGGGADCFLKRLEKIRRPGDVVVNSCTRGDPKGGELALRALVQVELERAMPNVELLQKAHPVSWHFSNRRR